MKVPNQEQTYFTEENSTEAVISRMNNCSDPRLRQIMTSVITHLHAAVKEIEPTKEEWLMQSDSSPGLGRYSIR